MTHQMQTPGRRPFFAWIFVLPAILFLADCGSNRRDPAVATIGLRKITLQEFKINYSQFLLRPNRFDSPETRKQFLESMIDHRLLALEGYRLGLDEDPWIRRFVKSYGEKLARDAYVERRIFSTVPKTGRDEAERVFGWLQQERRVRHLFATTRAAADSLRRLLDSGRSFESLARTAFKDSAIAARSGELGWVRWDQMDVDLAGAVFSLPKGRISEPVRSRFGYHIVQVEDVRGTPLLSETDFQRAEPRVRTLVEDAKKEKALDAWIKGFMPKLGVRLNARVYREVVKTLRERMRPNREPTLPTQAQISHNEWKSFTDPLSRMRDEPIAWFDGKPLTVEEFIDGLLWVPRSVTAGSLYDAVGCVIRDRYVTSLALASRMDRDPLVRMKTRLAEESMVDERYRASLVASLRVTDSEVDSFYAANKNRYTDAPLLDVRQITFRDKTSANHWKGASRPGHPLPDPPAGTMVSDTVFHSLSPMKNRPLYDLAAPLSVRAVGGPWKTGGGWFLLVVQNKTLRYHPAGELKNLLSNEILTIKRSTVVSDRVMELRRETPVAVHAENLKSLFPREKRSNP